MTCTCENPNHNHSAIYVAPLPANIIEAQREAAAQPPVVKAVRCVCGAPAVWEVSFADYPNEEFFCAVHLDPNYIADPIIWPAHICTLCEGAHATQACPSILAPLFAPEVCVDCGDPSPVPVCAACMEYGKSEQLSADRAIVGNMVRDAFGISIELRAGCTQSSLERVEVDGMKIPF